MDANGAISNCAASKKENILSVCNGNFQKRVVPCPWPTLTPCSIQLDLNKNKLAEQHLRLHTERLNGDLRCRWPKCLSRATFRTPSALRTHLINFHVNPLLCTHPGCTYRRPFGKQNDLNRHVISVHSNSRDHKCIAKDCNVEFSRKDKLKKHMREEHQNLKCPYNHCSATVLETKELEHLQSSHGPYECALGLCEDELASRFLEGSLKRHLRKDHQIEHSVIEDFLMPAIQKKREKIVLSYDVDKAFTNRSGAQWGGSEWNCGLEMADPATILCQAFQAAASPPVVSATKVD